MNLVCLYLILKTTHTNRSYFLLSFIFINCESSSGCCSVGPPCSVPNLLTIEEHLTAVSKILKKNSVAATDEHMMCTLFLEVAQLFGEIAGQYVDNDGQDSEVTL